MAGQRQRFYHRFIREQDLPDLEVASAYLFAFDAHELSLKDIISSDRWFCLAAVASSGSGSERIVGFVAAALGSITEFPQEAQYLQAALTPKAAPAAAGFSELDSISNASNTLASAAATVEAAGSGSSGGAGALALEVVLLGVVPEFRRRGVASRLIKQVKAHALTRGASLLFLHVQSSNSPARQLYSKAGFSAAALLPGYYSNQLAQRGQLGRQQQRRHDAATENNSGSSSSDSSSTLPSEFSGSDAQLLVMRLDSVAAATLQAVTDSSSSEELITASSSSSSSNSVSAASTSTEEVPPIDAAAAARASGSAGGFSRPYANKTAWSREQINSQSMVANQILPDTSDSSSSKAASSSSSKPGASAVTAEAATEAVTAAAAAAARLLLGPAIGLLRLAPKGRGGKGSGAAGPRGELVQVGDEWMVQVRTGRDVVMYDPEEVPADVLLSDRDKAVLQQQRLRQQELLAAVLERQQQQQQAAVSASRPEKVPGEQDAEDDDDDRDSHSGSGGGSRSSMGNIQQQQQPAALGLPPYPTAWHHSGHIVQECRQQHMQQQQQSQWPPLLPLVQMQHICEELQVWRRGQQQRQFHLPVLTHRQQLQRHHQPVLAALRVRATSKAVGSRSWRCCGGASTVAVRKQAVLHRIT